MRRWLLAAPRAHSLTYLDWLTRFAWFLLPFVVVLFVYTMFTLYQLALSGLPAVAKDLRWHALAFAGLVAILGGIVGAPLALIRVFVAERTAKTAEEQRQIAEQRNITDRITKAVELLGEEKTVKQRKGGKTVEYTEANLEVRLGAIYALERISKDSERDHVQIMEILSAYIRQNAVPGPARGILQPDTPETAAVSPPKRDDVDYETQVARARQALAEERRRNRKEWFASLGPVRRQRADVAAALTVIARRAPDRRALELANDPPFRIDLSHANFQRLDLADINLEGVNLRSARLEGAVLTGARLQGADLRDAHLEKSDLRNAQLQGADLRRARIDRVDVAGARLDGALMAGATTKGTNTTEMSMAGAIFT